MCYIDSGGVLHGEHISISYDFIQFDSILL